MSTGDPIAVFLAAACVPVDDWHGGGTLEAAEEILAAHPEVPHSGIHAAAVLADEAVVRRLLKADPGAATVKGGPHGWDVLTHLCFSRYLRLDPSRSDAFVRTATALLDAGASANTGFHSPGHQPTPEFESVLYGAAGVAHHAGLTRLLLERGADPNDGETPYHAPEGFDNEPMRILVESGKVNADGLTTMLVRKLDWTDYDGVAWLLDHGADPNHLSHWGGRALHHSLRRDNELRFIELLLAHRADPTLPERNGSSAVAVAARTGRADALDLFARQGASVALEGDDAFWAACTRADAAGARAAVAAEPGLVVRLQAAAPEVFVSVAGARNTAAVRLMLDLGFDAGLSRTQPAWERGQTAPHVAVWRGRLETVKALIERGAPLDVLNGRGQSPLALAVRAMVEMSEWTPHGSTAIVAALLDAGARVDTVETYPSGSAETDVLLRRHGMKDIES